MHLALRRTPAAAACMALVASVLSPTASAQLGNPIRQLGREIRAVENNAVNQQVVPGQSTTVIQNGQPVQGTVIQAGPVTATTTAPAATIGSHQIDRFEAIRQLQADVKSDPNNLASWAILGELAHEVAVDLPQGQDDTYYTLSRTAYEHAAQLDPNNNGLKAAVQFARDQEANAATFDAQRRQGVATYLDARRREMAMFGVNPTVQVYETPTPAATIQPAQAQPVGQVTQTYGQVYPTQAYRPLYNQQAQQPYSYNQYANGYTPVTATGGAQPVAPTTLRQFGQQLPGVLINQGVRNFPR